MDQHLKEKFRFVSAASLRRQKKVNVDQLHAMPKDSVIHRPDRHVFLRALSVLRLAI